MNQSEALVNGKPGQSIHLTDRGLSYGDGVFETIRLTGNQPLLWDQHINRLFRGLDRLNISPDFDEDVLLKEAESLSSSLGSIGAVLKIMVTRGNSQRGYRPATNAPPNRILTLSNLPAYDEAFFREGINLMSVDTRLATGSQFAGIKHLNRLEQVMGAREILEGFDEGVMMDTNDQVRDCTRSNLFLLKEGRLMTPDTEAAGVSGIMRGYILDTLAKKGIEAEVTKACQFVDLLQAEELFVCNSIFGIWPVKRLWGQENEKHFADFRTTNEVQQLISEELGIRQ